ncbi:MAG: hypothetical protein U0667_04950 [Chloroflexota bacterium]
MIAQNTAVDGALVLIDLPATALLPYPEGEGWGPRSSGALQKDETAIRARMKRSPRVRGLLDLG